MKKNQQLLDQEPDQPQEPDPEPQPAAPPSERQRVLDLVQARVAQLKEWEITRSHFLTRGQHALIDAWDRTDARPHPAPSVTQWQTLLREAK
jgi:hypothetical protein